MYVRPRLIGQLRANDEELERFRQLIRRMNRRSRVYLMLKEELTDLGHWRNLPRGNPAKGKTLQGKNGS